MLCHADTLVHPIGDEDNAVALIRFECGALGQFEVSWTFRGGMDLRDEVAGTDGTIWLNHFLRTGFEMFSAGAGRLRGREERGGSRLDVPGRRRGGRAGLHRHVHGHVPRDRVRARAPRETFYDGYVVNAVMDAGLPLGQVTRVGAGQLAEWRGGTAARIGSGTTPEMHDGKVVIKREILPDGRHKLILKDPASGDYVDTVVAAPGS